MAFSVTVLGLLIGAIAFGISLVRDRLYGQDLSDLEFVASALTGPAPAAVGATSTHAEARADGRHAVRHRSRAERAPGRAGGVVIQPTRRARTHPDRGGDPLDGLVNLFDLGIVLAVAFMLAALSSLKLGDLLTAKDLTVVRSQGGKSTVVVKQNERVRTIELEGRQGRRRGPAQSARSTASPTAARSSSSRSRSRAARRRDLAGATRPAPGAPARRWRRAARPAR